MELVSSCACFPNWIHDRWAVKTTGSWSSVSRSAVDHRTRSEPRSSAINSLSLILFGVFGLAPPYCKRIRITLAITTISGHGIRTHDGLLRASCTVHVSDGIKLTDGLHGKPDTVRPSACSAHYRLAHLIPSHAVENLRETQLKHAGTQRSGKYLAPLFRYTLLYGANFRTTF